MGKYVAAQTGCFAKAAGKSLAVDGACLAKGVAKITGAGKGCYDKNESKVGNDCTNTGHAAAELATADAFILDIVTDVDPGYPIVVTNKCAVAREKCAGKRAAGMTGCAAKANKDGVGDAACAPKIVDKYSGAKGCDVGALAKYTTSCLGAPTTASLAAKGDTWVAAVVSRTRQVCGDGLNDVGEYCDTTAPSSGWLGCSAEFASSCTAACTCACPTRIDFTGNASAPESILDTGWTGISHRAPIVSDGTATITMNCGAGSVRPCGSCPVSGPVANGPGQLQNQRCTNDTAIHCTNNTPCTAGGGTCQFFFGTNLPLAAGGVAVCAVNQFNGAVSGTANVETGEAVTTANLTSRVYIGVTDNPCPTCTGGFCSGGMHPAGVCVPNGSVPGRPDFGSTSLDCPPSAGALTATLPIDLSNATGPVTKTLSASSPNCSGDASQKCLCDTCNNLAATPCDSNADCTAVGATVCGGLRCLGGSTPGVPCVGVCPGGICDRPGLPTLPSACVDDSSTPGILDCLDPDGDGEGACTGAPIDSNCSLASGHAQRGCATISEVIDCGGVGTCISAHRYCFLTGGFSVGSPIGTNNLTAVGMADLPVADTSNPTIAAVFCVGPVGQAAVNTASGLPGPGRATITGLAIGHP
jgi:hypothetical protein